MQLTIKGNWKSRFSGVSLTLLMAIAIVSCSKNGTKVSSPYVQVGQTVTPGTVGSATSITSIKGTLQAGMEYDIAGDIMINRGDTLNIQPGAMIRFQGQFNIWVKGNLFSLGSKAAPILITYKTQAKQDNPSTPVATDPAYQGLWGGFWCDTSCQNLVLKWTNIQFAGAPIAAAQPPIAGASTGDSYDIFFQNAHGNFIMEDSWLYGGTDDAIRMKHGQFSFMRNTLEKGGPTGGDFFNVKGSSVGDCAFNLFIGCATNGPKASNHAPTGSIQTNCNFYNNTIVNSGYRMVELGRGGSIDYEELAKGKAYNNLIVNCRFGFRIVGATQSYLGNALLVADTAAMRNNYGYTYNYHDSASNGIGQGVAGVGVEQFYPVTPDTSITVGGAAPTSGMWAAPQATDYPNMISLINAANPNYYPGASYHSAAVDAVAGQNNPKFVNFPLPEAAQPSTIAYVTGYDFHLQSGSPAIGKGFTSFSPIAIVPQGGNFGANETPPGSDIGAYQSNGSGNQH